MVRGSDTFEFREADHRPAFRILEGRGRCLPSGRAAWSQGEFGRFFSNYEGQHSCYAEAPRGLQGRQTEKGRVCLFILDLRRARYGVQQVHPGSGGGDFTFVSDTAAPTILASETEPRLGYNVGTRSVLTVEEALVILVRWLGEQPKTRKLPGARGRPDDLCRHDKDQERTWF